MTGAPPDATRARFPLAEQAEEAKRELDLRYKVYNARVRDGKMTREAADRGIALMRAIRNTLTLFGRYEDEVRATLQHCLDQDRSAAEFEQRHARDKAELEKLQSNPAVKAVCDAFPGAEVRLPARADAPSAETESYPLNPETEEAE